MMQGGQHGVDPAKRDQRQTGDARKEHVQRRPEVVAGVHHSRRNQAAAILKGPIAKRAIGIEKMPERTAANDAAANGSVAAGRERASVRSKLTTMTQKSPAAAAESPFSAPRI